MNIKLPETSHSKTAIRSFGKLIGGYTIIEVTMATAILAAMIGSLMSSFGYGFRVLELVRENQRATQIILEKVEILRLYNWDQVNTAGFIPRTFSEVYDPQAPTGSQGITYSGTVDITSYPTSDVAYRSSIRQLVVTLRWTTGNKIAHSRTLATLIAKDGLQNYVY